jgi:lipid-A-disaccharide synthase-like uncharacterized protein
MAKDKKIDPKEEEKNREKERLEREKKEEAELKKKHEEKQKKKKEKEKRMLAKQKKEAKRVKTMINLPFKLLGQISLLITTLAFIIMFFGIEKPLNDTVFNSFMIFTALYLGVGVIMVGLFLLVSQDKLAEAEELRIMEAERALKEKKAEEDELAQMVELEKEIAAKKMAGKSIRDDRNKEMELLGETIDSGISQMDFVTTIIDEKPNKKPSLASPNIDLNEQQFMQFDENELNPFGDDDAETESDLLDLEAPAVKKKSVLESFDDDLGAEFNREFSNTNF